MGNHCKLYDENIVRNIMISTGVSIMEFVKDHDAANADDVCDFIEDNAEKIISETIKNLNGDEHIRDNDDDDDDEFPLIDEENDDQFK